jgi:DNA-binding transcriptional ArsR family regulator
VEQGSDIVRESSGQGLLLVPSVFTWPKLVVSTTTPGQARLIYGARGVARLWEPDHEPEADDDPIGALLGRTRAAILWRLDLPHTTTQLARALGQSPSAISQHLAVLRRTALVTSWRSGRSTLSRRTPLATSLLYAGDRRDAAGGPG